MAIGTIELAAVEMAECLKMLTDMKKCKLAAELHIELQNYYKLDTLIEKYNGHGNKRRSMSNEI